MTVSVRSASSNVQPVTNFTVAQPTGTDPADLLIAIHFGGYNNSDSAMTGPTGFTQLGSTFVDPGTFSNVIKVWQAPGTATAPYAFGGTGQGIAGVLAITGANVSPINVNPVFLSGPDVDAQIATSVIPTVDNALLICGWCCAMGGTCTYTPERRMTEQVDTGSSSTAPFVATIDTEELFVGSFTSTGTRAAIPTGPVTTRYASVTLVIAP